MHALTNTTHNVKLAEQTSMFGDSHFQFLLEVSPFISPNHYQARFVQINTKVKA